MTMFFFNTIFYSGFFLICIFFLPSLFMPKKVAIFAGRIYGYWSSLCVKKLLGVKIIVKTYKPLKVSNFTDNELIDKVEKIKVDASEINNNPKIKNKGSSNKKDENNKTKFDEIKNNNVVLKQTNEPVENLPKPDNKLNKNNTNKTLRKRVVKKVKDVLNNKNEIIKEKNTDKKNDAATKTPKSGWWERKI